MGEIEKLRALLAEARRLVGFLPTHPAGIDAVIGMQQRIDAALAEPVRGCESCGDKSYRELLDDNVRVRAERDEARAEVERLQRSCERLTLLHKVALDRNDEAMKLCQEAVTQRDYFREKNRLAFQRGAEAMREAAYQAAYRNLIDGDDDVCADTCRAIRTLRIPEDK